MLEQGVPGQGQSRPLSKGGPPPGPSLSGLPPARGFWPAVRAVPCLLRRVEWRKPGPRPRRRQNRRGGGTGPRAGRPPERRRERAKRERGARGTDHARAAPRKRGNRRHKRRKERPPGRSTRSDYLLVPRQGRPDNPAPRAKGDEWPKLIGRPPAGCAALSHLLSVRVERCRVVRGDTCRQWLRPLNFRAESGQDGCVRRN